MTPIVEYLEKMTAFTRANRKALGDYFSMEEFVLRHGREFKPAPCPKKYPEGIIKECYSNALKLALAHKNLIYCEGFAIGVIPVAHAWCVDVNGNVIDNTWGAWLPQRGGYFGIPMKTNFVSATVYKNERYGVIDDWQNQWPLLRADPKKFLSTKLK